MRLPTGDGMPWQPSPSAAGDVEPAAQDSRADPVPESVPALSEHAVCGDLPDMRDLFGSDEEPVVAQAPCPRAAMPVSAATASCSPGQPVTFPDVEADFLAPDKADVEKPSPYAAEPPVVQRSFVRLTWAEPLQGRSEPGLRMAVMRAISRLRASGIPVLRWHSDRAKEYASRKLQEWLTTQGVLTTMSAPEDHAANGRAEVAVREIKRAARRCLISANMASSLWPLAVRHASEQGWRRVLGRLGAPSRPLLPFETRVQAKNREWKCRHDKAWGARTVAGRLVGPAPHTLSAYVVQLHDGTLYVSSPVQFARSCGPQAQVSSWVQGSSWGRPSAVAVGRGGVILSCKFS